MCAMVFSSGTLGSYVVCALACEVAFHEPALPLLSTCCLRADLAASDAALRARRCTPNSTIHVHEQCCTPSFDDVYSTQPSHVHSVLHSLRTTISFSFRLSPVGFHVRPYAHTTPSRLQELQSSALSRDVRLWALVVPVFHLRFWQPSFSRLFRLYM